MLGFWFQGSGFGILVSGFWFRDSDLEIRVDGSDLLASPYPDMQPPLVLAHQPLHHLCFGVEHQETFERLLLEKLPKPRPESGLDCLICAESA